MNKNDLSHLDNRREKVLSLFKRDKDRRGLQKYFKDAEKELFLNQEVPLQQLKSVSSIFNENLMFIGGLRKVYLYFFENSMEWHGLTYTYSHAEENFIFTSSCPLKGNKLEDMKENGKLIKMEKGIFTFENRDYKKNTTTYFQTHILY